jgi:hypothetical protein
MGHTPAVSDDAENLALVAFVLCYGNAHPNDYHLAADVVAIDSEIVAVLERRERRRRKTKQTKDSAIFD